MTTTARIQNQAAERTGLHGERAARSNDKNGESFLSFDQERFFISCREADGTEFSSYDSPIDPFLSNPVILRLRDERTKKEMKRVMEDAETAFPGSFQMFLPEKVTEAIVTDRRTPQRERVTRYAITNVPSRPATLRGIGPWEMQPFAVRITATNPWRVCEVIHAEEPFPWMDDQRGGEPLDWEIPENVIRPIPPGYSTDIIMSSIAAEKSFGKTPWRVFVGAALYLARAVAKEREVRPRFARKAKGRR